LARDTSRAEAVPALEKLPRSLRKAMVNLMSREDLELEQAYERAATLLDTNSEAFDKAVKSKSNALYKSRHMTELNRTRGTLEKGASLRASSEHKRGYQEGFNQGKLQYEVAYRCKICEKPITIIPMSESHEAVVQLMHDAGWGHKACHETNK
jgi:hypothetical protein